MAQGDEWGYIRARKSVIERLSRFAGADRRSLANYVEGILFEHIDRRDKETAARKAR